MNTEEKRKLIGKLQDQAMALLQDNTDAIFEAYEFALGERAERDEDDKKFNFRIPLAHCITGHDPNTYDVSSTLTLKTVKKDVRTEQVRIKDDLVDEMDKAALRPGRADEPARKAHEKPELKTDLDVPLGEPEPGDAKPKTKAQMRQESAKAKGRKGAPPLMARNPVGH